MPNALLVLARACTGVLATGLACLAIPAVAQPVGDGPVRILVGYPPGGGGDLSARLLAPRLSEKWKRPVIVENKPGAGGMVGATQVAKSKPDGQALLMAFASELTMNPLVFKDMPYDPVRDLAPITAVAGSPSVIVAHPSVPAATLPEFITWAKANPKKVAYASSAVGSIAHFGGEYLNQNAGLDMLHVPYKGGAGSIASVLAGETAITFAGTAPILGHVQAGKLKALAVTGDKRIGVLPQVPTTAEAGLPGMDFVNWFGLFAPAGMTDEALERMNRDATAVLQQPEVVAEFGKLGFSTMPMSRAAFADYLAKEAKLYRRVAEAAKIRPE